MRSQSYATEFKALNFKTIRRLLKYVLIEKKLLLFSTLLVLLTTALAPLRPYLTKIAVDDNIVNKDWAGLLDITILIASTILLHALLQYILNYTMQKIGQNALYSVRKKLIRHINYLPMSYFDKNKSGSLVTRIANDVEVLGQLFSSGIVMILADILLIGWLCAFMIYTEWKLALMTIALLPILIMISYVFRLKIRVIFRDIRLQVSKINSFLGEHINGIATIKLFKREKKEFQKFDEINKESKRLSLRSIKYYAVLFPIIEFLSAMALAIILWYSSESLTLGTMSIGVIIAFIQYAEMFFRPVRDLTEKYTTLQSAMASGERIFEILDTEIVEENNNNLDLIFKSQIKFENLSFSYDEDKPVLKDIDFSVNKGEKLAIVGATGSGKTTIVNLLFKLYSDYSGRILFDDLDYEDLSKKEISKVFSFVQQDVFLFSRSIYDNISLNGEYSYDLIKQAAKELGADTVINKLENDYDTILNERGQSLSAGERQLISFCRAFIKNPQILVLDEASSNIDSETESIIESATEKMMQGRTSIIIAHRLSTIRKADRILVMHKGEIVESGTHKELLDNNSVYKKLYELQFKSEK